MHFNLFVISLSLSIYFLKLSSFIAHLLFAQLGINSVFDICNDFKFIFGYNLNDYIKDRVS